MKTGQDFQDFIKGQFEDLKPHFDKALEPIERLRADGLNMDAFTARRIHQVFRKVVDKFDDPGPDMAVTEDFNIPSDHVEGGIPVRYYQPHGATDVAGPTILFLHGGGFLAGNIESHEGIAKRLASGTNMRVLSVDYRLAPEHPYPAGPDDCEAVLKWLLEGNGRERGMSPSRVAISGDSAGGNMSAYLAQKYRDKIKAQVLFYPLMQLVEMMPDKPGPQDMIYVGTAILKYIDKSYLAGADPQQTRVSPLFEKDLMGLPPAFISTCSIDPLRFEGKAYADKLEIAGVTVEYTHEKMMPHGYLNFAKAFPAAKKTANMASEFLLKHL